MANSQKALANLKATQKTSQNPAALLATQEQQLGVQGARDTVKGLRGAIDSSTKLLKQVAPSVMGRTGGSLVTAAQAARQIQNEQAPISENLSYQTNDYGRATEDLSGLEGRALQASNLAYQGQQDKLSYLQNLYNTMYGREQDAKDRAFAKKQFKESRRQFNKSLQEQRRARAASSGGGGGSGGIDLGSALGSLFSGGGDSKGKKANPKVQAQQQAYNWVRKFVSNKNRSNFAATFKAIKKSASYGNKYDAYKIAAIKKLNPKLWKKFTAPAPKKKAKSTVNKYYRWGR